MDLEKSINFFKETNDFCVIIPIIRICLVILPFFLHFLYFFIAAFIPLLCNLTFFTDFSSFYFSHSFFSARHNFFTYISSRWQFFQHLFPIQKTKDVFNHFFCYFHPFLSALFIVARSFIRIQLSMVDSNFSQHLFCFGHQFHYIPSI